MVKQTLVSVTILASILSPSAVLAMDYGSPTTTNLENRETKLDTRMQNVEANQADVAAKKAAIRQKNLDFRKAQATKIFNEQKENANRLLSIIARLRTKLLELQSQGKDVTTSLALLDTATTSINTAKAGADAGLALVNTLTTDNLTTVFPQIRTQAKTDHTNLESARKNIRQAIQNALLLLKNTKESTSSAK